MLENKKKRLSMPELYFFSGIPQVLRKLVHPKVIEMPSRILTNTMNYCF